jgi:hypothetical protein
MFNSRAFILLLSLALCGSARAWEDAFSQWKASAYIQVLQIDRFEGGLAPAAALNDQGNGAGGYNRDGLFGRKVESKLWGPLGWEGWSTTLGVQTDLSNSGFTDLLVGWQNSTGSLKIAAGQQRLPFGWEQQLSGSRTPLIQRELSYGFANYGHLANWGLGILNERAWGLRGDWRQPLGPGSGPLSLSIQAGAFEPSGFGFKTGAAGLGRAALRLDSASLPLALELGYSGHAGRNNLVVVTGNYEPLGFRNADPSTWTTAAGAGGKATVITWGPDASLDLLIFHARAELVRQALGRLSRGGGALTAWLDLLPPSCACRKPAIYARTEQAWSGFADGVRLAGALYKARTFGLQIPLPWRSQLKVEDLELYGDDFIGGIPGGHIDQAQLQLEF